jgi:hypothetical protein
MKNKIKQFSLTPEEYEKIDKYSKHKGLTIGQFAKFAMYAYMSKYPFKKALNDK